MKDKYLLYIITFQGLLFLRSSIEKIEGGKFVSTLGETLAKFASKNPYPWYKSFLENIAIPNSKTFGTLTMWGELLAGIGLSLGCIHLLTSKKTNPLVLTGLKLGLLGGLFLNMTFYFAASWTSPSTESVNLLMMAIEVVGLIFVFTRSKSS